MDVEEKIINRATHKANEPACVADLVHEQRGNNRINRTTQ